MLAGSGLHFTQFTALQLIESAATALKQASHFAATRLRSV
jgi:hypothetical protein